MNIHNSAEETTITKTRVVVSLSLSLSLPYTLPKSIVASSWLEEGRGYWVTVRQEWQGQARDNPSALMILDDYTTLPHSYPPLPPMSRPCVLQCILGRNSWEFPLAALTVCFCSLSSTEEPQSRWLSVVRMKKTNSNNNKKKNRAAVCCIEFNILYNTVIYILLHQYYRTYRFRIIFILKDYIYH